MNDAATTLRSLLTAELDSLKAVETTLEQEHDALLDSNPASLEAATTAKNAAVEQHRRQQTERLNWMTRQGFPGDLPLSELLTRCGADESAGPVVEQLTRLAQQCQDSNRRNGGLIMRLQEHARGALDVLRREDSSDVYSLSGAREHRSDSRTLGKA